ncbi:hypothetical protein [Weissella hellenica]|uniref:hypothetical protein n=1 Tax=Weissella hellenica TaxID=46256 RepID=UPI003889992A
MKKSIKFCLPIVVLLVVLSIIQYRNDYKRALYSNNISVVTYAQSLRLDEGSKTLDKYYIPQYNKNVANAKNFAMSNIGHYKDLFKGTDISKASISEMRQLRNFKSKSISDSAMERWRDIDPDRRGVVYYNYLGISSAGVMPYLSAIYDNPLAYSHTYSHKGAFTDKYMLKNMDKEDVLGEYIDQGGYDGPDEQIDEDGVDTSNTDDSGGDDEASAYSESRNKVSSAQKAKDNKYTDKLQTIASELNSLTGLDYDYEQQAVVKLPSEYPKKTKTYEALLAPRHNKEGEDVTGAGKQIEGEMPESYNVKLRYDKESKTFKIVNLDDMPDGFVED